jgi:hypothetical protein
MAQATMTGLRSFRSWNDRRGGIVWSRHEAGGDDAARAFDVTFLVVKENMRARGFENRRLFMGADEMGFIGGRSEVSRSSQ